MATSSSDLAPSASSDNALICAKCGLPLTGRFARALDTVFHPECFRCQDCNVVVTDKFFQVDDPDGKRYPLCERDYFSRLNLTCATCDQALRGKYITACKKKFHVDHFTCSVCPTHFGPKDSYYEHEDNVYCHFHFSTRCATRCAGCSYAILKQYVEINRNMRHESWHPECYKIHKFWNVKIVERRTPPPQLSPPSSESLNDFVLVGQERGITSEQKRPSNLTEEEEEQETAQSLHKRQVEMMSRVERIWTVLSTFEQSSAACISDMLKQISDGQYLEAVQLAEKFILHVEVLFATIDDIQAAFSQYYVKGMSYVREARMICRRMVDLLTLLSNGRDVNSPSSSQIGMSQDVLFLVTGLAHYLKILIRIALTGSIKLKNGYGDDAAVDRFLDKLHRLSLEGANPLTKRLMSGAPPVDTTRGCEARMNDSTQGVIYGYKSLAPESAGYPSFIRDDMVMPPSDLCLACNLTVEEDCVRVGTYMRWHSHCVKCKSSRCKRAAAPETKGLRATRPPAAVDEFLFELKGWSGVGSPPLTEQAKISAIFCTSHANSRCRSGFQAVSRLEQNAFLLNVALRRFYLRLKKRGIINAPPTLVSQPPPPSGPQSNTSRLEAPQQPPEDNLAPPPAAYSQNGRLIVTSPVDAAIRMWDTMVKNSGTLLDDGVSVANTSERGNAPPDSDETPAPLFEEAGDDDSRQSLHRRFSMLSFESVTVFDGEDAIHVATKEAYYCDDDDTASIRTFNSLLL